MSAELHDEFEQDCACPRPVAVRVLEDDCACPKPTMARSNVPAGQSVTEKMIGGVMVKVSVS